MFNKNKSSTNKFNYLLWSKCYFILNYLFQINNLMPNFIRFIFQYTRDFIIGSLLGIVLVYQFKKNNKKILFKK